MNSRMLNTTHGRGGVQLHGLRGTVASSVFAALAFAGCGTHTTFHSAPGTANHPVASPAAHDAESAGVADLATPSSAAPTAGAKSTPPSAGAPASATPVPASRAAGGSAQVVPAMTTMTTRATPAATDPVDLPVEVGKPTLFWLEIASGLVTTANADGSGAKMFAAGSPLSAPDGVTVDPVDGHVFVLNMGSILGGAKTGSLVRYKLDGSHPEVIMMPGTKVGDQTFNTGKQVTIDKVNRMLYLGDREGSKVWRCDLDGKNLEVLVSGHGIQQIVGVAADPIKKQFYFSDRNGKKLYRANMAMPAGKTHADRDDLELLYLDKAPNAMPLDIELDVKGRMMYWTDRQQNTVFGMSMDMPSGSDAMTRTDVKMVATGLLDVIGLGLDHEAGVLYATHSGSVSTFKTDGSGLKQIGSSGSTGIAFAKIP
jgi:sugar lactone lactonase YvrE